MAPENEERAEEMGPDGAPRAIVDWRSHLVIVTGRFGAGRTTAIGVLEDLGFDRVDGAPLRLIPSIAAELLQRERSRIAMGVDARTAGFSPAGFAELLKDLKKLPVARGTILFLDGSDEALRRRYTETRRRHPLVSSGTIDEGLAMCRRETAPIKDLADLVIDTSAMTPNELRRAIVERVAPSGTIGMTVEIVSFAYKYGLPPEADLVFDCRFLRNPHYDSQLRVKDGRDPAVAAYVKEDALFQPFFEQVMAHLHLLRPAYEASGKSYLTIAFGCTGGKHRSVALAEMAADALQDRRRSVRLRHREREREALKGQVDGMAEDAAEPSGSGGAER